MGATRTAGQGGITAGRAGLTARLRPLYSTAFLQGFALWYAVEKLFMRSIGFTDYTITVATAVYIVVMMAASIPLGVLADRWSRKGVLYLATAALAASSLVCGLARGFWLYAIGISIWGLFYAAYTGIYDSVIYDLVLEQTGSADSFERCYGRAQMYNSAAFITGALISAGLVHGIPLRATYFLTVPVTCCGFITLARFREPLLHRAAPRQRLADQLGQVVRAASGSRRVALIAACLICNALAMRLIFEFCQLWWLGLNLPAGWYGPAFALLFLGSWLGGYLAARLAGRGAVLAVAAAVLSASAGLLSGVPAVLIAAQVATITGIITLQVILFRYLHDAMPSAIRAGVSSAVSTIGLATFIPVALGFGVLARDQGVLHASALVIGALAGMCLILAVILLGREER
jgi:predicted MFS family arabinose efflux permease